MQKGLRDETRIGKEGHNILDQLNRFQMGGRGGALNLVSLTSSVVG